MLPSGAALAAAGVPQQIAPLLGIVQSQTSALSSSMAQGVGSLTDAVDSAMRSGIISFNNLSSSLSRFGSGLSSTLEGMWNVGSGAGTAGDSANGLAILGGGSALLQQLGGGALSALQGVGNTASSLFGKGSDAVGSIGKTAGRVVGGAVGGAVTLGAGVAGAALSVAFPPAAAILGVVSSLGPLIGNALGGVVETLFAPLKVVMNGLSAAFSTVTSVLGVLGDTALKALGAFGSAVMAATEAALKMAHEVASIRNNTGRSLGDSQRGYWSLRGAGMSGEAASSFIGGAGSSFVSKAQTRAWGLPDVTDPEFAEKFARLFQKLEASGPGGYERAKAMADTVSGGHASPALLQMAHQKPETIAREQKWTQGVQKSLGVSPEAIRQFSDEFPLFINRISNFVEAVKVRFGTTLLPFMQKALAGITDFLGRNADNIATAIKNGVMWVFTTLPPLLLNGAGIALDAFTFINNAIYSLVQTVADNMEQLGQGKGFLYEVLSGIAGAVDFLVGVFAKVKGAVTFFWMEIENSIASRPWLNWGFKKLTGHDAKTHSLTEEFDESKKAHNSVIMPNLQEKLHQTLINSSLTKDSVGVRRIGERVYDFNKGALEGLQNAKQKAIDFVKPDGSGLAAILNDSYASLTNTKTEGSSTTTMSHVRQNALTSVRSDGSGMAVILKGGLSDLLDATNNVSKTIQDTSECEQSNRNGMLSRLGGYIATDQFLAATR